MPRDGNYVNFYLSVNGSTGSAQPTPNNSRGYNRSSTKLEFVQSFATAAMTSKEKMVDTARVGDNPNDYDGAWLLWVTGTQCGDCRKIANFDEPTRTFSFELPFDGLAASGDFYRVYQPLALFDEVTASRCGSGTDDYRMIYVMNETGLSLTNSSTWLKSIRGDACGLELCHSSRDGEGSTYTADIETAPPILLSPNNFETAPYYSFFESPRTQSAGYNQPKVQSDWSNLTRKAMWLRRLVDPAALAAEEHVWQIYVAFDEGGGDPDPLYSSALIVGSSAGFTPSIAITESRAIRIGGGCRVTAHVDADPPGVVAAGVPVKWGLTGDGTLYVPDEPLTDVNGDTVVIYHASIDPTDSYVTYYIETLPTTGTLGEIVAVAHPPIQVDAPRTVYRQPGGPVTRYPLVEGYEWDIYDAEAGQIIFYDIGGGLHTDGAAYKMTYRTDKEVTFEAVV